MDAMTRRVLPLLPVLTAFAETRQTTAAADILQIPQSTVSRTLTRIGDVLGAAVVERRGRNLRLTAAGEALLPHAAAAVNSAHAGVESVRARSADAHGTIALAFQGTLGERVVPALVKAFLNEHPAATVELNQTSRQNCLSALDDGTAEIALVSPTPEQSGWTTLRLHTEPLLLVVPPGHRFAMRPNVGFEEAAQEMFVSMKPGYGMRTYLDDLAESAGFTPRVAFEGDDLATLRGLVSTGLGVGIAPRDPHGAPGCVEVPITDTGAVRTIGACWQDRPPSALAAAFRSLLRRRGRRLTEIGLRVHQV